ncbi:MAG: hypothetical protein WBF17_13580 [Phycisphaerae bacterium]
MGKTHFRIAVVPVCVAALAIGLSRPQATGQSRNRLNLGTPGTLTVLGRGTVVGTFRSNSFGLGSLQSGPTAPGMSALQSSIYRAGHTSISRRNVLSLPGSMGISPMDQNLLRRPNSGLSIPRSGLGIPRGGVSGQVGAPVLDVPVAPPVGAGRTVTNPGTALAPTGDGRNTSIGDVLAEQDETALGAARAYLQALEEAATSKLRDSSKPITSLVPTPASEYRDHMAKGDRAFRDNNLHLAYSEFRIANDLGGGDAESLVCLTHTQFALSRYSYATASYFLQRAVKHMPELPLANLRPRGFYDTAAKYAEHLVALEDHLEKDPADGEALLLLAYFRWFEEKQDVKATHDALAGALASALKRKNTHLLEAVETFWDGIVASGKASGKLIPPEEPATEAQPGGGVPAAAT